MLRSRSVALLTSASLSLVVSIGCSESPQPDGLVARDAATTTTDGSSAADAGPEQDAGFDTDAAETGDTGTIENDGGLPRYTWWQHVQPIVAAKCQLCHAEPPQFGAPRALVSYEDTQRLVVSSGAPVHVEMVQRIHAAQNPMPPPSQPPLTAAEKEIIRIWSLIGAPEGTPPGDDAGVTEDAGLPPADAGAAPDSGVPANYTTIDMLAFAPGDRNAAYPLPTGDTTYTCWSFTIPPGAAQQYAVSFEPIIDNATHIHHTLLFRDRNGSSPDGPFSCGGLEQNLDMVAGWAPGRGTETMPPGVGTRANPGDRYVLQAHYDRVMAPGLTDRSGVRVTLTDQPGLIEAGVLWHGPFWLQALTDNASRSSTCRINQPVNIFAVFPHMHMLGTRITLELQRAGTSAWDMVAEVPAWSFEDQPNVPVPMQYQQLQPGDRLRTTCWWTIPMNRQVPWGEASNQEMCFNFINHYPLMNNANTTCLGLDR